MLMNSPFQRMYDSFQLFSNANLCKESSKIIQMSAGVNWARANSAIKKVLHWELDYSITYRNYGRSVGGKIITDIIENIEQDLAGYKANISAILCHGSSEGAYLILEYLKSKNKLETTTALSIGHSFPLYHSLSQRFNLDYQECLVENDSGDNFLPTVEMIRESINKCKPSIVFLIIPNNPIGDTYSLFELIEIASLCKENEVVLLVDRVCQLSWDSREFINKAFFRGIEDGIIYIVDSFSKSESLAGVRTGYIITNDICTNFLSNYIQYRQLNPIVFSSGTLAFNHIAYLYTNHKQISIEKYVRLISAYSRKIFSEYPKNEQSNFSIGRIESLLLEYEQEVNTLKKRVKQNFNILKQYFDKDTIKPLVLTSGFNTILLTNKMKIGNEYLDQELLALNSRVGVLTESCFRVSKSTSKNYFVRIGLSLPNSEFEEGVYRIKEFYHKKYS